MSNVKRQSSMSGDDTPGCSGVGPTPTRSVDSDSDSGSPPTDDERLNIYGDSFDALLALRSKRFAARLPWQEERPFDNLAMYTNRDKRKAKEAPPPAPAPQPQRKFLPHQLPVKAIKKDSKNVLKYMKKVEGPMSELRECVESKLRIKHLKKYDQHPLDCMIHQTLNVVTRNEKGIRGYCIGFLQAFDKMWNLAMTDVLEVWTRKKHSKTLPCIEHLRINPDPELLKNVPEVIVTSIDGKTEKRERHIPQLFMRGEHVVLINILRSAR